MTTDYIEGLTTWQGFRKYRSVDTRLPVPETITEKEVHRMEKLISRKEVAKILGISVTALDQARSCGHITYVQYGCVYFTERALQEYVARCTHRARPLDRATD